MIHEEYPVLQNETAYGDNVGLCMELGEKWTPETLIICKY